MAATVNEVVERYTLDDAFSKRVNALIAKMKEAERASQKMHKAGQGGGTSGLLSGLGNVGGQLKGTWEHLGKIASGATMAATAVLGIATAAGTAAGALAFKSLSEFAVVDANIRTWSAFLENGAEDAKKLEKYIRGYMQTSNFNYESLSTAVSKIVMMGGDVQSLLPVMERLATVSGNFSVGDMEEVASIFQRLKGGSSLGELRESLGRFGISIADVKQLGQLDESMVNDSAKVMDAVIKTINTKLACVTETAGGSVKATMGNVGDSITSMFIKVGEKIAPALMPMLDKMSSFMSYLSSEDGPLDKVMNSMAQIFGGGDMDKAFNNFLGDVITFVEHISGVVRQVVDGAKMAGKVLGTIALGILQILRMQMWIANTTIGNIARFLSRLPGGTGKFFGQVGKNMQTNYNTADALVQGATNLANGKAWYADEATNNAAKFSDWEKKQKTQKLEAPKAKASPVVAPDGTASAIEKNTRNTANNTAKVIQSLERYVLGGGDLGAMGVSAVEMRKLKGAGAGGNIAVNVGSRKLSEAMTDMVGDVIAEMRRRGVL